MPTTETAVKSKLYVLLLADPVEDPAVPTYKMVVCATSVTKNMTNNVTKTETKCRVIKAPGSHDATITLNGVTMINPAAGHMSEYGLHQIFNADKLQAFKIGPETPEEGDTIYTGEGYVSVLNTTWPTTDNGTFDVTIDVTTVIEGEVAPAAIGLTQDEPGNRERAPRFAEPAL